MCDGGPRKISRTCTSEGWKDGCRWNIPHFKEKLNLKYSQKNENIDQRIDNLFTFAQIDFIFVIELRLYKDVLYYLLFVMVYFMIYTII